MQCRKLPKRPDSEERDDEAEGGGGPFKSSKLSVKYTEREGRFVVATGAIEPGQKTQLKGFKYVSQLTTGLSLTYLPLLRRAAAVRGPLRVRRVPRPRRLRVPDVPVARRCLLPAVPRLHRRALLLRALPRPRARVLPQGRVRHPGLSAQHGKKKNGPENSLVY